MRKVVLASFTIWSMVVFHIDKLLLVFPDEYLTFFLTNLHTYRRDTLNLPRPLKTPCSMHHFDQFAFS